MKKVKLSKLWLVLAAMIIMAVLIVPAMAAEVEAETPDRMSVAPVKPERFAGTRVSTEQLSKYVDVDAFIEDVLAQAASCPDRVNISKFNIPSTDALMQEIKELIWYRTPLAFHMYSLGFDYNSSYKLTYITVDYYAYADTPSEYTTCYNKFMSGANKLLSGVEGNTALTDVQKALLLHDRLVQWVAYDWENYNKYSANLDLMPDTDFTAYGVFGERVAVCQGYAMAYMYMLDQVGIENDYVDSETLCHAWNIVYINGKPYHVDATWDDPDMLGMVDHDNFLLSSTGLWNTGHEAYDYNTEPSDTTYEDYLWANCDTEFQLIGNRLYFLDYYVAEIRYWSVGSTGKSTTHLRSADDGWPSSYGNYSVLGTKGNNLIYSTPNTIYLVTSGGGRSTLYKPTLGSGEYIYGFTYEDGVLRLLISPTPYLDETSAERYVSVTLESSQYTVTFKNWDGTVLSTKTYSKGATLQVPANPTRPADGNFTYKFAGWTPTVQSIVNGNAVYTATYTATPINGKHGWVQENNNWYYYENGTKVTNAWRSDSAGKCYLTADGTILKNGWAKEGQDWRYLNQQGYIVMSGWAKDSHGWCYLENGYMLYDAWRQDNAHGWCYIDKYGYWVENGWAKDSVGWCYIQNGFMIYNAWRQDTKGWCYIDSRGYMVTNGWAKDSHGWCYMDANGYISYNTIVYESSREIYCTGDDGYMVTNTWVWDLDYYKYRFMGSDGRALFSTSMYIDGVLRYFDSNGFCTNPY